MKMLYSLLTLTVIASACQNNEKPAEATQLLKADTTLVAGPELPAKDSTAVAEEPQTKPQPTITKKKTATKSTQVNSQSASTAATEQTAAASQPTAEPAPEKKDGAKQPKAQSLAAW
ncbi:MAG: hypothetical protein EOO10_11730 [Chitinophagaceae bacterium]|nr:MAG: hypothetical protein EOO10_11730 [Chitinophagaceae bacterium]